MAMNGQEDRPRWAISGAPKSEKIDSSELLFWLGALFGTSSFHRLDILFVAFGAFTQLQCREAVVKCRRCSLKSSREVF